MADDASLASVSLPSGAEGDGDEYDAYGQVSLPSNAEGEEDSGDEGDGRGDAEGDDPDCVSLPSSQSGSDDDIAEFYSPPRVVPVANKLGLKGDISFDLETDMDFTLERFRAQSIEVLSEGSAKFLILLPP